MFNEVSDSVGRTAVQILKGRLEVQKKAVFESLEGSQEDLNNGCDYRVVINGKVYYGAHRHVKNALRDSLLIRYSRPSGKKTEFDKLKNKPDDFILSYSWGALNEETTPVSYTSLKVLRRWLDSHVVEDYLSSPYKDGVQFLKIPVSDVKLVSL